MRRCAISICLAVALAATLGTAPVPGQALHFVRGDSNSSLDLDLSDAVHTLNFLFSGGPEPGCLKAADSNDSGFVDLSDAVYSLGFLFLGTPAPPAPFPTCGTEATEDEVTCNAYAGCDACLSQSDLDHSLATLQLQEACIPPNAWQVAIPGGAATVCPAELARDCGAPGEKGCPIRFTAIHGSIDAAARRLNLRVEGRIDALPAVVSSPFGSTTCQNDIAFGTDASVALQTETTPQGLLRITNTAEPLLENLTADVDVSGGLLCDTLETQLPLLIGQLETAIEDSAGALLASFGDGLVGVVLCP
jgi:hypothetical protein